jgi:hypothetical protein
MSMGAVRQAIAAYLNGGIPASLPGFNHCYRGQPTFIDPTKWWVVPAELGAGTLGWLHLALVEDDRIAYPAVQGQKFTEYTVALPLIYRYPIPTSSQSPQLQGDEWVNGWDATVEAIKAFIRADPNLGTGSQGIIWQAAQTKGDLRMSAGDMPVRDETAGEILNFGVLDFHVTEVITA